MAHVRRTVEYTVELDGEPRTFKLYVSPTQRERHQIDGAVHDIAGGLEPFLDLTIGIEAREAAIVKKLEQSIWPAGRPEAGTDQERQRQDAALDEAFEAYAGADREALDVLRSMRTRLSFLANWSVLLIEPVEYKGIADRELDDAAFGRLIEAHRKAVEALDAGNGQSSRPSGA